MCVVVLLLIFAAYRFGWTWTGFVPETSEPKQHTKTLWDWLQLFAALLIPVVIAVFSFRYSRQQRQTENAIALDNQQEAALQAYLDRMSELLLEKDLRASQPDDEVRNVARARTLTVLPRLDAKRKGTLIQFLYESNLIHIIDLSGADLSSADLNKANLNKANLLFANLSRADLSRADLSRADLDNADLSSADLRNANLASGSEYNTEQDYANVWFTDLSGANLSGANLGGADLSGANLGGADLSGANLRRADLSRAALGEADLSRANLSRAFLSFADLSNANLSGADLRKTKVTQEQMYTDLGGAIVTQAQMVMLVVKPNVNV